MTAADTNILVYAHRIDSPFHNAAATAIRTLAESQDPWAIPWPCVHEFLAVVTNGKIFRTPTPPRLALRDLEVWMESPGLNLIGETPVYWDHLKAIVTRGSVSGPKIHDARIAAICKAHGVDTLLSADRDFSQFPGLTVLNPLKHGQNQR